MITDADVLEELNEMLHKGVLNDDEYQRLIRMFGLVDSSGKASASPKLSTKKQRQPKEKQVPITTTAVKPRPKSALSCPKCQTGYESGDVFCANCGFDLSTVLTESPQTCPKCGQQLEPDDAFCPGCGTKL